MLDFLKSFGQSFAPAAQGGWDSLKGGAGATWDWMAPRDAVTGARGGVAPYLSNPNTWFGAMGTGLGIYSHLQNAAEQRRMNQQIERLANQPLNIDQYYKPMSDAAMQAFQRSANANMVAGGIPADSSYLRSLGGEALAKTETDRWLAAADLARGMHGQQLYGLLGRQGPNMQLGDFGAFGSAIALQQQQAARKRAEQAAAAREGGWQKILQQAMGGGKGSGPVETRNLGLDFPEFAMKPTGPFGEYKDVYAQEYPDF